MRLSAVLPVACMSDILSCQASIEQSSFLWMLFWVVLALIALIVILILVVKRYWDSFFETAIAKVFERVDLDHDGTISANELHLAVMNLAMKMPVQICTLPCSNTISKHERHKLAPVCLDCALIHHAPACCACLQTRRVEPM